MPRDDGPERGFTLVEVLVALLVAALILSVVMNGAVQTKARSSLLADQRAALSLAQNRMEMLIANPELIAEAGGQDGEMGWRIEHREIARDPRGLRVLMDMQIIVTGDQGTELARLGRRILLAGKGGVLP
ncbi:MAG: prepilin-type N-terminal cleavage/methylation domain-containing protein [Blastomonas sp.]